MAAQSSTSMPPPGLRQSASANTNTTPSETQFQFRTKSTSKSSSKSTSKSSQRSKRLPIRTYHCAFCKQILLATTRDVERLPRREGGGLDRAVILPLPSEEQEQGQEQERVEEDEDDDESESGDEDEDEDEDEGGPSKAENEEKAGNAPAPVAPVPVRTERQTGEEEKGEQQHYTILLSTTSPSTQPTMIRRTDGFEKRFLIRCGRCRLACGYALDRIHFPQKKKEEAEEGEKSDGGADVVYILPGAVVETEDMMSNTENTVDMAGWERWEDLVPS